jgi:hypothetical protein
MRLLPPMMERTLEFSLRRAPDLAVQLHFIHPTRRDPRGLT